MKCYVNCLAGVFRFRVAFEASSAFPKWINPKESGKTCLNNQTFYALDTCHDLKSFLGILKLKLVFS